MKLQLKKLFPLFFFAIAWVLPTAKYRQLGWNSVLFVLGTFIAVIALHLVKSRVIALLIAAAAFAALVICDVDYLFAALPPFLLTCAHKEAAAVQEENNNKRQKNKQSDYSYIFVWLNLYFGIAVVIYGFIALFNGAVKYTDSLVQYIRFSWWMCLVFIVLFILSFSKQKNKKGTKTKKEHGKLSNLRSIYIMSIVSYIESLFCFYANSYDAVYQLNQIVFFPWFIYIASLIYDGDAIIDMIIEKTDTFVTKLSVIDRVKK